MCKLPSEVFMINFGAIMGSTLFFKVEAFAPNVKSLFSNEIDFFNILVVSTFSVGKSI